MYKSTIFMTFAFVGLVMISSCNSDGELSYNIPEVYEFTDSEGNSTVDFSGQTARKGQLAELTVYMKTANTPGVALTEAQLLEMYSNNNSQGSTFFTEAVQSPGKDLRSKTARGEELYQLKFDNLLKELASGSSETTEGNYDAAFGQTGVVKSGSLQYLVNEKGVEWVQLIEKGLMGAVFYDQIHNVYLGQEKMNVDNSIAVAPSEGKFYTAMEHHWDEAFGYFTGSLDFPANGTDSFWGKYSNTVDPNLGTNQKIMDAFIAGRAAVTNNDLAERDRNIEMIRQELEKVSAATAIHYLNRAVTSFSDDAIRTHVLSEAAAFIEALYFTAPETAVATASDVDTFLTYLKDDDAAYNFYLITTQDITDLRDMIANKFGWDTLKGDF